MSIIWPRNECGENEGMVREDSITLRERDPGKRNGVGPHQRLTAPATDEGFPVRVMSMDG